MISLIIVSGDLRVIGGLQIYVRRFIDFAEKMGFSIEVIHRPGIFPCWFSSKANPSRSSAIIERSADLPSWVRYVLTFFTFVLYGSLYCLKVISTSHATLIHVQDTGYAGLVGLFVSKFTGRPLILHVHGKLWTDSFSSYSYYERTIGLLIAKNSDRIILVSRDLLLYYRTLRVPSDKMIVLPTGVNLGLFHLNPLFNSSGASSTSKMLKIGYVGRLDRIKNVESLIRGFAKVTSRSADQLSLIIVGDGPDRRRLEDLARNLGVNATFKGFVNDVVNELSEIDVFVLPSLSEGCPLSLFEAMASGKAIIASNIPSIREIVRHHKEAILIDPHDADELSQAILLLCDDSGLRVELCRNARERVELYDVDKGYRQILEIYQELTRAKQENAAFS